MMSGTHITAAILRALNGVRADLKVDRLRCDHHLVADFGLSGRGLLQLCELLEEELGILLWPETVIDLVINGATVLRLHQEIEAAQWLAQEVSTAHRALREAGHG